MITRIFHPIGQGAFYSEKHEIGQQTFTIVYDCGCCPSTKIKDTMVKNTFPNETTIDILFISHFDFDHVSKIPILKAYTKIKRVIMPLLHEEEKMELRIFYRGMGENELVELIENPEAFFGENTIVIRVNEAENRNNDDISIDIQELNSFTEINSGTKIGFGAPNWVFIPYNHKYKERHLKLVEGLKEVGIILEDFFSDPSKAINEIEKKRKVINELYAKLEGKVNQNSMLVYSGPYLRNNLERQHFPWNRWRIFSQNLHYCNHYYCGDNVACIYTGDADLNITKIEDIYRDLWMNVGTVQISHHGSFKSFNESFLENGQYLCPISFGEKNNYGHPSSAVVAKIVEKGSIPIYITDREHTIMIETIEEL